MSALVAAMARGDTETAEDGETQHLRGLRGLRGLRVPFVVRAMQGPPGGAG